MVVHDPEREFATVFILSGQTTTWSSSPPRFGSSGFR
jgi:hypothetical protein